MEEQIPTCETAGFVFPEDLDRVCKYIFIRWTGCGAERSFPKETRGIFGCHGRNLALTRTEAAKAASKVRKISLIRLSAQTASLAETQRCCSLVVQSTVRAEWYCKQVRSESCSRLTISYEASSFFPKIRLSRHYCAQMACRDTIRPIHLISHRTCLATSTLWKHGSIW
jgi:hypothetical protein